MLCLNKILSIWVVAVGGKTSFTLSLSSTQSPTMISRTLLLLYGARKMNHGYVKRLQVDVNQLFFSFVPPFSRSRLQLTMQSTTKEFTWGNGKIPFFF